MKKSCDGASDGAYRAFVAPENVPFRSASTVTLNRDWAPGQDTPRPDHFKRPTFDAAGNPGNKRLFF